MQLKLRRGLKGKLTAAPDTLTDHLNSEEDWKLEYLYAIHVVIMLKLRRGLKEALYFHIYGMF